MSKVNIISLSAKATSVLRASYNGIRYNPMLRLAYKHANVNVYYEDATLSFQAESGINENNLIQIKSYLASNQLKENKDYKIEVLK